MIGDIFPKDWEPLDSVNTIDLRLLLGSDKTIQTELYEAYYGVSSGQTKRNFERSQIGFFLFARLFTRECIQPSSARQ